MKDLWDCHSWLAEYGQLRGGGGGRHPSRASWL